MYKQGKLPIKYGIYGGKLNQKNVSLEHLLPHSYGGKTELSNLALATKENNSTRGNQPLKNVLNLKTLGTYLDQFKNIHTKLFDGNEYIKQVLQTIGEIL